MSMKKTISKALAMAVMMSVWCGSAYADSSGEVIINGTINNDYSSDWDFAKITLVNANGSKACYTTSGVEIYNPYTTEQTTTFSYVDIIGRITTLEEAGSSGGGTSAGTSYTKAESDARYLTEHQDISGKADQSYVETELSKKANQTDLDTETQERKDADDKLQKQINDINSGSSAGLNELNNKINQTNDRVDRVGATAAALAGIHYQPMAKGQSQVAVGMGGYKGKKATALGLAYQISDRISGSVAGAANGSEHMFNVGFNYLFGQHSDKDIAQCAAVPGSVSLKEAELQSEVDSLKADNQAMKAHIAKQDAEMAELKAIVKALAAK